MKFFSWDEEPSLKGLKLAVIGHVEWVTFLSVDKLPIAGNISHAKIGLEEPAGGGAVAAVQLSRLVNNDVHFFTALGRDSTGEKSYERLEKMGLKLHVGWREKKTRKGISMTDQKGDRAITVIGERLQPTIKDRLPWDTLSTFDGVYITATNSLTLKKCRESAVLVTTPRIKLKTLEEARIKIDAFIGSGLDPDEKLISEEITPLPALRIATEGEHGGMAWPGGRYNAVKINKPIIDSYGCGDSFAAGVTAGLSAGWSFQNSINLGAQCGAECCTHFGPYN